MRTTHGRRVGAESSLRDAGDMGINGIDGVFAEIPANGGGVEKFARNVANWFYQRGAVGVTTCLDMCYRQRGPVMFCPRGRVGTGGYEEP